MRKIISIAICVLFCIAMVGCEKGKTQVTNTKKFDFDAEELEYKSDKFDYDIVDPDSFTVDSEGNLYVALRGDDVIKKYDKNGVEIETINILKDYFNSILHIKNDILYISSSVNAGYCITEYNLTTKETISHKLENITVNDVNSLSVIDGKAYILYKDYVKASTTGAENPLNDNYKYNGEATICFDLKTNKIQEIDDEIIKNAMYFSEYSENELIFYAHDIIGGYYFVVYNCNDGTFGEKIYNNTILDVWSFKYAKLDNSVIFGNRSHAVHTATVEQPVITIDILPDFVLQEGESVCFVGDYCYIIGFYTNSKIDFESKIVRLNYEQMKRPNKEIKMCTTGGMLEEPYGCGYKISLEELEDEKYTLKMLASDKDFDISLMTSSDDIATTVRDKKAYFPLNDVPYVKEYLDECFPYLKDVATNENGDIWMIPINISVPYIIYNPEVCRKKGMDFANLEDYTQLYDMAKKLYQEESNRNYYSLNDFQMQGNILSIYQQYYAHKKGRGNYDTELFRKTAEFLKSNNVLDNNKCFRTYPNDFRNPDKLIVKFNRYLDYEFSNLNGYANDNYRAVVPPQFIGEKTKPNPAECTFLYVNTNSENLYETLKYISTYCSYLMQRTDAYTLADINTHPYSDTQLAKDFYDIINNSFVYFEPPYELFYEDFMKYLKDEITLDKLIDELDRKADMYLNE